MTDPIAQATDQHHADEAARQRRAEALTEEIYADLPAHLDDILEFTDAEAEFRAVLNLHICPFKLANPKDIVAEELDFIIEESVKKIVGRRLEP